MAGYYLEIRETFPKSNESNVSTTRDLIIDWSADIDTNQFQDSNQLSQFVLLLNDSTNEVVPVSYSSYTARQRRLTLSASLLPSTTYRLIIRRGVRDSFGRSSLNDYTIHFSTAASPVTQVTLYNPSNGVSLEAEPYVFNWSEMPGSGSVSYVAKFYENTSLIGSFTTSSTGLALVAASYTGVLGDLTGRQLSWEVVSRVAAGTGFVYGPASDRRTVFFGAFESEPDITSARTYVHPSQTVPLQFSIESYLPENYASNLVAFPTVEIVFTEAPATGSMLNYISFTRKTQLPRNDVGTSYLTENVSGSWSLSGRTLTFVPTESIDFNRRYEIKLTKGMASVSGQRLSQTAHFQFSSQYNPYYVDIRVIKAALRSEANTIPDDFINYHIFLASLDVKARYYSWLYGVPDSLMFGDMLQETWIRDSNNLRSYGALKWVEACTLYNIYNSILVDEIRNVGRSRSLADYKESLDSDFLKAIEMAKKSAKDEMDYWDNFITNDGVPAVGIRQFDFDRRMNNADIGVPPSLRWRDDDF